MIRISNKTSRILWWVGVPLLTFASVFLPYWIWSLAKGFAPFWRVPIFYGAMFDITWYLPQIGSAMTGFDSGGFLHWFRWPLAGLSKLLPNASVPEIWFISRWIMTTIGIWIAPWCFQQWSDLSPAVAKFFSISFWFSLILALGMRPGIYGWWLPLCFLGLTFIRVAYDEIQMGKIKRACLWSLASLPLIWLYSWFFAFGMIWLGSIWSVWLIQKRSLGVKLVPFVVVLTAVPFIGLAIQKALEKPELSAIWDMYGRIGLAFTHMPVITNSFFVVPAWIILLVCLARLHKLDDQSQKSLVTLLFAWLALLFSWQLSTFMGVAFQNDHFRVPTVLMSWISFAFLWSYLNRYANETDRRIQKRRIYWLMIAGVLLVSLIFIVRNISSSYVFHDEYLNVLHLSHWFITALASGCILFIFFKRRFYANAVLAIVLGVSMLGGVSASAHIHKNELTKLPGKAGYKNLVMFLRNTVPKTEAVCSDPETAAFLGIHIARLPHPTVMSKFLKQSNQEALKTLTTLGSAYDVAEAGYTKSFRRFVRMDRYVSCVAYKKESAWLKKIGVSDEAITRWTGCPQAQLDQEQEIFKTAMEKKEVNVAEFQAVCPWVAIPKDQKQFWRLPDSYGEYAINENVSVWSPYLKK